ncbi:MAG: hypothetical protein AAF483_11140 [Planctomycetota bacterium]
MRELIDDIKPIVRENDNWIAGSAILASLEAMAGNFEPAKQWVAANYETVRAYEQESDRDEFLASYAGFLGVVLEGRDRELDLLVIKLYEQSLKYRNAGSPYRESRVHELAKLYHQCGRSDDGCNLLYGLVDRESKVDEYLVENWGRAETVNLDHERIWDLRTAVTTLNSIGRPMDSLSLLSRITFEQRRKAGQYKGGGYHYNDSYLENAIRDSQKLVSPRAIVKALGCGVLPIGLASNINEQTGEIDNPIIELLEQVARTELSGESKKAFADVNPRLMEADVMGQHLADLMQQEPANSDIVVAASIYAFLRDDIDTAKERLKKLAVVAESNPAPRAADVNLHLVAKYAVEHNETSDLGFQLAQHAMKASKDMDAKWQEFFQNQ